jgi:hypothetical protein
MKNKFLCSVIVGSLVVLLVFVFIGCKNENANNGSIDGTKNNVSKNIEHWEYMAVRVSVSNINNVTQKLNQLGLEGWELVSVGAGDGNDDWNHYYYFKRRLP